MIGVMSLTPLLCSFTWFCGPRELSWSQCLRS